MALTWPVLLNGGVGIQIFQMPLHLISQRDERGFLYLPHLLALGRIGPEEKHVSMATQMNEHKLGIVILAFRRLIDHLLKKQHLESESYQARKYIIEGSFES